MCLVSVDQLGTLLVMNTEYKTWRGRFIKGFHYLDINNAINVHKFCPM